MKFINKTLVFVTLLASPVMAQTPDNANYCSYVEASARAQALLLTAPSTVAGETESPISVTVPQIYVGMQNDISGDIKARRVMKVAKAQCDLYKNLTPAQQDVTYGLLVLEKRALQHRLDLLDDALGQVNGLLATAQKGLDVHNIALPTVYALQSAKARLQADKNTTASLLASMWAPELDPAPLHVLLSGTSAADSNLQLATAQAARLDNWSVLLEAGVHHNLYPTFEDAPAIYGNVTFKYSWGAKKRNENLDKAASSEQKWQASQQSGVAELSQQMRRSITDQIGVQASTLAALRGQASVINSNLALVQDQDTPLAVQFTNVLRVDLLLERVDEGTTQARLDNLQRYLAENF